MNRRSAMTVAGLALLPLVISQPAVAQKKPMKEQLVGSWSLVSLRATGTDGKTIDPYGPNGKGTLTFERNGRFALILVNPDSPKFASNLRDKPTPEEALSANKDSFSFFGSYSVDESDKTFVFHVEACSYPNFNGTNQKRIVKNITETELRFTNLAPPTGGTITELVYRRNVN